MTCQMLDSTEGLLAFYTLETARSWVVSLVRALRAAGARGSLCFNRSQYGVISTSAGDGALLPMYY
jgi:hypothetical protein